MYQPHAKLTGGFQRHDSRLDSGILRVPYEAKGTYATVPGVLYVAGMAITALWSFWQLLDQCYPMIVNFHGTNNSNTWGFYIPGSDSQVARAERHGNTFLISTNKVRKLLLAARQSVSCYLPQRLTRRRSGIAP